MSYLILSKVKLRNNLSIDGILQYLEPFMIYQKDLTYTQYVEFNKFISEQILAFKSKYVTNKRKMDKITSRTSNYQQEYPYLLLLLPSRIHDNLIEYYDFRDISLKGLLQ